MYYQAINIQMDVSDLPTDTLDTSCLVQYIEYLLTSVKLQGKVSQDEFTLNLCIEKVFAT